MKQCRRHELVPGTRLLGEPGTLEHMLGHRHGLAEIFLRAPPLENVGEEGHDGLGIERGQGHAATSWTASASIAARVESSPSLSA